MVDAFRPDYWVCGECNNTHDTRKEATECCKEEQGDD